MPICPTRSLLEWKRGLKLRRNGNRITFILEREITDAIMAEKKLTIMAAITAENINEQDTGARKEKL